jgi:hypothetical protein
MSYNNYYDDDSWVTGGGHFNDTSWDHYQTSSEYTSYHWDSYSDGIYYNRDYEYGVFTEEQCDDLIDRYSGSNETGYYGY